MRFFHHLAQFVSHKKPPTPADRSPTVHRQFTDSLKSRKMRHHYPISCFGGGSHGATPPKMRFHQVMSQFTADRSPTVHRHFTDCLRYCQKTLKIHKFEKFNGKCSHFTQNREKHGSVLNWYTFSSACSAAL